MKAYTLDVFDVSDDDECSKIILAATLCLHRFSEVKAHMLGNGDKVTADDEDGRESEGWI